MAPGSADLRRLLTLGGRAPIPVGAIVVAMAVATLLGAITPVLARPLVLEVPRLEGAGWLTLLELWRLVTWPLYQGSSADGLLTLIFAGLMIVWMGRQLCHAWGDRGFVLHVLAVTAGGGALTILAMLALGGDGAVFFGGWPLANALLLTWALVYPRQRLTWFGVVEMTGATVAKVVAIGTVVWAALPGPLGGFLGQFPRYTPHLMALLVAWLLVTGGPRRLWYRLKQRWLERDLARKRKRFQVVTGSGTNGRIEPPRWVN